MSESDESRPRIERQYGQWTAFLDDLTYGAYNEGLNGEHRFYDQITGPHNNPIFDPEPHLAFPVPKHLRYVDIKGNSVDPVEKITGVLCKRAEEVIYRFNLTNFFNSPDVQIEEDGAALIIKGARWHLRGLFQKDKNRIKGYDAYYYEEDRDAVVIKELEDVDFE